MATVLKGRKGRAVFKHADKVGAMGSSSDKEWYAEDEDSDDEDG